MNNNASDKRREKTLMATCLSSLTAAGIILIPVLLDKLGVKSDKKSKRDTSGK